MMSQGAHCISQLLAPAVDFFAFPTITTTNINNNSILTIT